MSSTGCKAWMYSQYAANLYGVEEENSHKGSAIHAPPPVFKNITCLCANTGIYHYANTNPLQSPPLKVLIDVQEMQPYLYGAEEDEASE
eukprot:9652398-Ditylum_brightwellii.AAC.1